MLLHILFGQIDDGAPHPLAIQDDATRKDWPDGLEERLSKARTDGAYQALAIIPVEIDGEAVARMLRPDLKPLAAKVITP